MVLMKVRSAQGLAQIAADAFETVLFNLVRPWLIREQTPIVVSGLPDTMRNSCSSAVGTVPCRPTALPIMPVAAADDRLSLHAFPGLHMAAPDSTAVAHESLIRGVAADMPDFDGAICIPDAQTLWVEMDKGEVTGCQTFLSAELVDLLAPLNDDNLPIPRARPIKDVFLRAVEEGLHRPDLISQKLVHARCDPDPAKSVMRGLLIGVELAATRNIWEGKQTIVIETEQWSKLYAQALQQQGASVRPCDSDQFTLSGLKHAYRSL